MNSEENKYETVIIEGQVWAVTPGNEDSDVVTAANRAAITEPEFIPDLEPDQITDLDDADAAVLIDDKEAVDPETGTEPEDVDESETGVDAELAGARGI